MGNFRLAKLAREDALFSRFVVDCLDLRLQLGPFLFELGDLPANRRGAVTLVPLMAGVAIGCTGLESF
jgi:hypothetical protein